MMESWTETGNFTMFFESTADMKETAFKAMMLNLEMYDAQLRYADGLVRDSFEIATDWAEEAAHDIRTDENPGTDGRSAEMD